MSFREFYAALYAKFPPEDNEKVVESEQPYFTAEELRILDDMNHRVIN